MNVRRITSVPMSGPATYGPDAGSITRWTISAEGREKARDAAVAKLRSIYSGQVPDRVAREIADAALDATFPAEQ